MSAVDFHEVVAELNALADSFYDQARVSPRDDLSDRTYTHLSTWLQLGFKFLPERVETPPFHPGRLLRETATDLRIVARMIVRYQKGVQP